jgi:quercetin dioxygenase-like cupin family protein
VRSILSRLVLAGVVIYVAVIWSAHDHRNVVSAQQRSPVTVIRIYTGPDGQTHAEQVDVKLTPVAGKYAQWWEQSQTTKVTSSQFVRNAPGFVQDWHPAGARRYLITLSGRGEVELAGGEKILLEPGRVLQAEDVSGKGHITRTLGNEDWIAFFVQFDQ